MSCYEFNIGIIEKEIAQCLPHYSHVFMTHVLKKSTPSVLRITMDPCIRFLLLHLFAITIAAQICIPYEGENECGAVLSTYTASYNRNPTTIPYPVSHEEIFNQVTNFYMAFPELKVIQSP